MRRKEIKTERLRLAPLRERDGEELIAMLCGGVIGKTYMVPELDTEEQKRALFTRLRTLSEADDRFVYGIFKEDRIIGMIHEVDVEDGEVELGYFISPAQMNRGYASEALSAAIEELFAMGFAVVKAAAFEGNEASFRVMQKCGMAATGERERISYRGAEHDCAYYAVKKEDAVCRGSKNKTEKHRGGKNMGTFCGADCSKCGYVDKCPGCEATLGSPFGGCCVAAECVKAHGAEAYRSFKQALLEEINALLASEGFPPAERLYELNGAYVNLEYPLPCGGVKLLDDKAVYLGAQIECPCRDSCCGVVAGAGFIIICTYRGNGTDPELVLYKKR